MNVERLPAPRRRQGGIALLEALLATLILAIGMLGTIGLQARAQSAINESGLRAEATIAADMLLGSMVNDQANLANYALAAGAAPSASLAPWHARTLAAIPGAAIVVSVTPAADFSRTAVVVSISWVRKTGGPTNRHLVTSYIAQS
jgi:type IV pilus assembly protein PilV